MGKRPRYRVTVPHSLAVPDLLLGSDMLSIVPAPLAAAFTSRGDLHAQALALSRAERHLARDMASKA